MNDIRKKVIFLMIAGALLLGGCRRNRNDYAYFDATIVGKNDNMVAYDVDNDKQIDGAFVFDLEHPLTTNSKNKSFGEDELFECLTPGMNIRFRKKSGEIRSDAFTNRKAGNDNTGVSNILIINGEHVFNSIEKMRKKNSSEESDSSLEDLRREFIKNNGR